ncbi:MAG: alpha-mannosidase [Spirochaetales bacterium]|nr:alpha-mannosidase [Spirochaetales bacterium]
MAHVEVVRRNLSFQQWAEINFRRFKDLTIKKSLPIGGWQVREGEYYPEGYIWDQEFRPIRDGESWGGPDVTAWFETRAEMPGEMAGERVYFKMNTPTEVMVSDGGTYIGGLDPNRYVFKLEDRAPAGKSYRFTMEAYTRSKPDDDRNPLIARARGCIQQFSQPAFVLVNEEIQSLVYDLDVLLLTAYGPAIDEDVRAYLENKIKKILPLFPTHDAPDEAFLKAAPAIAAYLQNEVYGAEHPFAKTGKLACVAHSHLDIAYYWRAKQTVQKNARTVLIQLKLMEEYPEFTYAHTQAWTYETLEVHYPALFEQLKQKVKEGQWEITGGMYVEPDCNVVSAESLVRQILFGKNYFSEKFEVDVDNCWLPDVFGNSAVLPQILKKSGIPYFVSNKMSTWNDTNRFPHNHFIWRGVDGSEVYACVPPVHFITWMDPNQAADHWNALQDKELIDESLQMYGYGDGGSGATAEMLEFYKRQEKLPGVPRQRMTTGKEFLHSAFDGRDDLPRWTGDLYLEMHRGTFTNKGILKKLNRKGEFALQEAETLALAASLAGFAYPREKLAKAWKILLANQFHDILPGTHVMLVTKDTLESYDQMFRIIEEVRAEAEERLTVPEKGKSVLFNPYSWKRKGLAALPDSCLEREIGDSQLFMNPDGSWIRKQSFIAAPLSPVSFDMKPKASSPETDSELFASPERLESPWYRLDFNEKGEIIGLTDKIRNRQLCTEGNILNQWQVFEDAPGRYNAWDIVDRFEDKPLDIGNWDRITPVEQGPLSAAVKMERSFLNSRAVQIVRLYRDHPRVDFQTRVEWDERERLLKVAFPTDLHASRFTCDNSAGITSYENHRNTSWQQARFEVPFHKWVDISEGLFGVSLMSDSKYGCDVKGGQLRMSLLRGSIRPDLYSDRGTHEFTYALTTHGGQWQNSHLLDEAYELNAPLKILPDRSAMPLPAEPPLLSVEGMDGMPCLLRGQALKTAEDGSGDIIFRAVEYSGTAQAVKLHIAPDYQSLWRCDMLENCEETIKDRVLKLKPFEIVTVRIGR